jgi:alkanesulfonate monooxygenase SsuD/methylene tetrahydromethanopterin reductase-like flavin-dependent oxidoreductase (luciferase family)
VSTAAIVESYFGQSFEEPIQRLDETIDLLRKYFSGERFSYRGKLFSPMSARLRTKPTPRIALAALNDQMISRAARLADRVILNLYPTDRIPHAVRLIERAVKDVGKSKPTVSVMLYSDLLGEGEKGLDCAKDLISFYASAPAYSSLFSSIGFAGEAKAMMDGWKVKDRDRVKRNVTRQMIDRLMVLGTIHDLRARVKAYHESGVDDVFITPSPFADYEANIRDVLHNYS